MKEIFTRKDVANIMDNNPSGNIVIPEGITIIDMNAFCGCTSLTSVNIPNSVTEIWGYAFCGCTSLTSVNIPNSVTEIGEYAFACCSSLEKLHFPESLSEIGHKSFKNCRSLKSITIEGLSKIGDHAFEGCVSLESVDIKKDPIIEYCAFLKCNALQLTGKIGKSYNVVCRCCGKNINTRKDACLRIITNYEYDQYMCLKCGRNNIDEDKYCMICTKNSCIDCAFMYEDGRFIPDDYALGTEWLNSKGV